MPATYKKVLTIAGSDSGGGAGIQADLKTFSALGGYGMSVITALTAQNTQGVQDIYGIPPAFIKAQLDSIFTDMGTDAVKVGMLHNSDVIRAVKEKLTEHQVKTIVLDPVMVAQSGDKLLADEAIDTLKNELIPLATCITPNLPEAEVLLERQINNQSELQQAAIDLLQLGSEYVLLKGGHLHQKRAVDVLAVADREVKKFESKRINTHNTHGTGCTLSSAIATYLARDFEIKEAVRKAKEYMTEAIQAGTDFQLGSGYGPVHHFYQFWDG
jgi:hydroxymethylpyrimidine/phosphomethylpyrimidine kinase